MRARNWKLIPIISIFLLSFLAPGAHAAPTITNLSVPSGPVGTAVTITGTNFGSTQGTSTVKFNGTTASVTSWSGTSIGVTVPSAATTGNVVVTVSGHASNGVNFTVTPAITSLSVTSGAVGASVTITGTTFGSTQGTSTAKFNGTTASITTWGSSSIAVTVPSGATTGNVVVTVSNQASNGVNFTVVPAPSITSLSVTTGAVGAAVTINGSNFGTSQGTSTVKFNGTTATVTTWGASSIAVTVPSGATTGSVVVHANGVDSNGSSFTVVPAPSISSLSITTGAVGAALTITGSNFGSSQGSGTVTFNGTTATVTTWGASSVGVTVPSGATTGNVVVNASGVTSNGWAFTVAPSITSLSPTTGAVGAEVAIAGANFGATQGSGSVSFNGAAATPTSWSASTIAVPVPSGTTTGNVVVNASGMTSNGVSFTVVPAPTISSLSLTSGVVGTSVTVTGTNFGATQGSGTVSFNWTDAAPTSWSATSIVAPVPIGATTGNVVVSASGVASNGISFTVVEVLGITSVSPTSGVVGEVVTLTGTGFGATQGSSTISLHGTSVTVANWSDTRIVGYVPSGASSGPFSVTVNGQTVNSGTFTVTPLPSGWSDGDIGSVGLAGSGTFANGTFTIKGAGLGTFSTTSDGINFVSQSLSGDGTIVARVVSQQGSTDVQAGVMVRETLDPGATNAYLFYRSSGASIYLTQRTSTGATSSFQSLGGVTLAYWVKLTRSGNTFNSYGSPDGVNWTQLGSSQTITMVQNVYVGLAVSSRDTSLLATATFDNVSVSSTAAPAPAITGVSATTGSTGSLVTITGTGFGTTQNGSLVTLNGVTVPINSWSGTSIVITIPAGATSGNLVVSVAPSMNDSNPVFFTVTSQPLPTSWLDGDVGAVGVTGTATYANGTFTVAGAGLGTFSVPDGFHFVYQPLSGDGTIVARVVSVQGGSSPQVGVMIRETLDASATNAFTFNYSSAIWMSERTSTGASATYQSGASATLPYWVKLVRSGSTFSGYSSYNGQTWTQVGTSQTISMAQTVYIGLAVTSRSTTAVTTATFDNVSVSSTAAPAPVITNVSATTGSIGSQVVISGTNFGAVQNGGVVTLNNVAVTINSWEGSSILITIPSGATSGYLVVSVAPSMNDSNPVFFTVTSQPLTISWLDQDVGQVGVAGSATYASGVFTIKGSGTRITYGTADQMHFVYQPLSGDGTIIARVVSATGSTYPRAGVMIRETLDPASTNALVQYWSSAVSFWDRPTTGGSTTNQSGMSVSLPYWVKLIRSGSTFSGYSSYNGTTWTQIGTSQTITMAQNVYIGLAVSSNDNSTLATATFDNVSISTPSSPAPIIASVSS